MLGHSRYVVRDGKVVELTEEVEKAFPLQVRVIDEAHVSHALPRRQDAPGMNWDKFADGGKPRFDTNNDVREFTRRNPAFARE